MIDKEQVTEIVFYGIKQPGFGNKHEAIQTMLKTHKIQIYIEGEAPTYDERGLLKRAGNFIIIGVKKLTT